LKAQFVLDSCFFVVLFLLAIYEKCDIVAVGIGYVLIRENESLMRIYDQY